MYLVTLITPFDDRIELKLTSPNRVVNIVKIYIFIKYHESLVL